jgi:NAD(P)-dependent dehydrogenase (short-subunit alcohol dehydrogenase family)
MSSFTGKKILLTGASSGIGRACALSLAAEGAHLVVLGRNEAALAELDLPEAHRYTVDLTDEAAVKKIVAGLKAEIGALDGCVLAAGLHTFRPLMMESFAEIYRPWSINAQSCLGLLALLLKSRLIVKGGSVVLFSSAAARMGAAGAMSYAASKGAIESATMTLAVELASQRIRVNAVSPGVVRTPMSEGFLGKLDPAQLAALEARHPMGFGTPEDVAGPVKFLLSSDARWITGVVLPVDGGYSIS